MGAFQEYLNELDEKVNKLKQKSNGEILPVEILRLIYIDLGQKMNFDLGYTFGNSKQKRAIYEINPNEESMDNAIKTKKIICKSIAYMLDIIVPRYGFKSVVKYELDENGRVRTGAHVYNIIYSPDGKSFSIDLEEDMEYIQTGAKTKHFAIKLDGSKKCAYDDEVLRRIDKENGYIPEGIYMDDIMYLLEKAVSGNISDDVLFEFILDNLNKYRDIKHMGYRERILYYERMIYHFFDDKRFDPKGKLSNKSIEGFDCYRLVNGERQYISCLITNFNEEKIYLFNNEKNCYEKISAEEFIEMTQTGLMVPNQGRIKKLKRFKSRMCCMGPDL